MINKVFTQFVRYNSSVARKMVQRHYVNTKWEEFEALVTKLEAEKKPINILFSGDKDEAGVSWCPYCNRAAPVIEKALENAPEDSIFIKVEIERPYWKDPNNSYRKDPRTKLVFLPTLLRWKSPQRLDGEQACNKDLVEMLFEDDD
ncbi:thioredoxin domain-containing protein 17 [Culicoides brevitarsis]|uniref:thioredoxin domain-containing protein 17 n=1 Tax=Culicoides brevitarsis TaxID=469753 RepID=UPI00307BCB0D